MNKIPVDLTRLPGVIIELPVDHGCFRNDSGRTGAWTSTCGVGDDLGGCGITSEENGECDKGGSGYGHSAWAVRFHRSGCGGPSYHGESRRGSEPSAAHALISNATCPWRRKALSQAVSGDDLLSSWPTGAQGSESGSVSAQRPMSRGPFAASQGARRSRPKTSGSSSA